MGKWVKSDTEEAYGWLCTSCNSCQTCNASCNVTCNSCQGCNNAQNFCATEQVASKRLDFNLTLPTQYSNITPDIYNNIKTVLINIYNYGDLGTRNPDTSGLTTYTSNTIEIPAAAFNNLAQKINHTNLVEATKSIITQSQLAELLDTLNAYQLNTDRCNTCNTAANTTCTSCQGCNSAQACYEGCYQDRNNVTKWCAADYCERECACGNCLGKESGVWQSLC